MANRRQGEIYTNPLIQSAGMAAVVVPTDNAFNDMTARISDGIWVGQGGDLNVVFAESVGLGVPGEGIVIPSVPTGTFLPFRAVRIRATGTTASNIKFLYGVK